MPRFHYRARTQRGEAIEGYLEAGDRDTVAGQLMNTGVTPIDIAEAPQRRNPLDDLRRRLAERNPGLEDLLFFSRQMYSLMRAGVPIIRAINGLAETSRNPVLARTLGEVVDNLESGRDLAGTLRRYPNVFSPLFASMVQVGETAGRLDESFRQIADHLEREKETRDRIKAAMRYPIFVVVAIAAAIVVINLFVIPQFAKVFEGFNAELPLPTKILIGFSGFMVAYWPYLAVATIGAILGVRAYVRTDNGRYRWDRAKLRIPIVGNIILRATLARYARAFAMSMRSGVPLIQSMTVVPRALDNEYMADRLLLMRNGVERGENLTRTASTTGLFTPLVIQMLSVGEETGQVDDMLGEVAGYYEREVDYDLRTLSQSIEPILIIFIGIMVLVLALGVFLPMWDLGRAAFG